MDSATAAWGRIALNMMLGDTPEPKDVMVAGAELVDDCMSIRDWRRFRRAVARKQAAEVPVSPPAYRRVTMVEEQTYRFTTNRLGG